MWRLSLLTGWVKKHSGSSGQLAGVHLPQGRPGRAFHQAPQGVGERARHSSHRSVHGADAEVPGERQGASEIGPSSGKGSSSREKRVARGVGIAAVQFKQRPLHRDAVHGERGASGRVDRSGCSRKQHALLTPGHANGRGWSDGGTHTSEKMPGSVANAARGIVTGPVPSGNV
jgi:hypothetical protein